MPRRPRVFAEGAIYHVYVRTARRERVFAQSGEAERFLDLVREVKRQDGFALLAWCVMPSHYHLVLRTAEVPLSRSMRLIQGHFAQGAGTVRKVDQGNGRFVTHPWRIECRPPVGL